MKHTISKEDYKDYKHEVILASSTKDKKTLYAVFTIDDGLLYKINYEKGGYTTESFDEAIKIYNNI